MQREQNMERAPERETIESVKLRFIEQWDDGAAPTLQQYLERYPEFAPELSSFVLSFVPLEAAAARDHEVRSASETTLGAIRSVLSGVQSPADNLVQTRKAMGWTLERLAREMNLPVWVAMQMERGGLRDWPRRLEEKLAEVICRSRAQAAALLLTPPPAAAAHYKAKGRPPATGGKVRSFREALQFAADQGDLTDQQRQEWLRDVL